MTVGRTLFLIVTSFPLSGALAHPPPDRTLSEFYEESTTVVELRVLDEANTSEQRFSVIRSFLGDAKQGAEVRIQANSVVPGTLNDHLPKLVPGMTGFAFLRCPGPAESSQVFACELVWPGAFLYAVPELSMRVYVMTHRFRITPQMYIPPHPADLGIPLDRLAVTDRLMSCSRAGACPARKTFNILRLHQRQWPPRPPVECPPRRKPDCDDTRPTVSQ